MQMQNRPERREAWWRKMATVKEIRSKQWSLDRLQTRQKTTLELCSCRGSPMKSSTESRARQQASWKYLKRPWCSSPVLQRWRHLMKSTLLCTMPWKRSWSIGYGELCLERRLIRSQISNLNPAKPSKPCEKGRLVMTTSLPRLLSSSKQRR